MLKHEDIRQKYAFFRKGLNDFEVEWIACGCIYKFAKECEKTIVTLWILSTKNLLLTA